MPFDRVWDSRARDDIANLYLDNPLQRSGLAKAVDSADRQLRLHPEIAGVQLPWQELGDHCQSVLLARIGTQPRGMWLIRAGEIDLFFTMSKADSRVEVWYVRQVPQI